MRFHEGESFDITRANDSELDEYLQLSADHAAELVVAGEVQGDVSTSDDQSQLDKEPGAEQLISA